MPVPPARDWHAELRALLGWRRILNRLRAVLRSAVITFVVLTLTLWLMPGVASADVLDTLGLVLLVAGVGAVLRPLLLVGITALGGWGAMLLGAMRPGDGDHRGARAGSGEPDQQPAHHWWWRRSWPWSSPRSWTGWPTAAPTTRSSGRPGG